jgi:hypothetical protein
MSRSESTDNSVNDVRETARLAYKLGLTPIPPRQDGSKRPISAWRQFQTEPPSVDDLKGWFSNGHIPTGVGLITGGRLECFEFDDLDTYHLFRDTGESGGLGPLIERIEAGYMEETPGGGIHWLYLCDEIEGNQKLAQRRSDDGGIEALIETRGNGGFVIIAPSHGNVHESGKPYRLLSGGLDQMAEISPSERQELFDLARALDQRPKREFTPRSATIEADGNRPGDEFTAQTTWPEILNPHGWQFVFRHGETEFWRRPGKRFGWSATINGHGVTPDRLYVFTSSSTFEPMRSYDRFQAFTFLEHEGDFSAAARDVIARGYVEQPTPAQLIRDVIIHDGTDDDAEADDDDEPKLRFTIHHAQEIKHREPPPQLIRGVLVDESHAAIIGNSGTYKSFLALEMAARIANGGVWYGYPVEQGPTLYITGEGQASFGKRIQAWERTREETANVWILPEAVQFPAATDIEELLRAIYHYIDQQPRLIVIDTLARSAVGMDENSSQDMGLYIAGVDRIMREFDCAALTIHHANKQGLYRGSSALRAAWDTVIESRRQDDGSIIVSCDKQKDLDEFRPMTLRPDIVELKPGQGLQPPVTSLVLNEDGNAGVMPRSAKIALEVLCHQFPDGTRNQQWEDAVVEAGIGRRSFYNAKKKLVELGLVRASAGDYTPLVKGDA